MSSITILGKLCGYLAVLAASASIAAAAEHRPRDEQADKEQVEMFAAIGAGQIEVQLIPRDSTQARVVIKNKTKRPLRVQLPEAFAASPVLAQAGVIGGGGSSVSAGSGGGAQSVGGGMGGFGGPGGVGAGNGFFNVPAEKVGRLTVPLVCLEHGKKEPRPAIPYQIKPIDQFSSDPVLAELLIAFGRGADRRATQAAAWHLANHMSWRELSEKQIERLSGPNEPYFSSDEIRRAAELVSNARLAAAERPQSPVHGESQSPGEN